jgi:hypothetical protein
MSFPDYSPLLGQTEVETTTDLIAPFALSATRGEAPIP